MALSALFVRSIDGTVPRRVSAGFSLVEVTVSIGIVAFAFVALFGLIPTGLTTFRQAMDSSIGSQIAQRVISDVQQTDFDVLIDEANLPNYPAAPPADYTFRAPRISAPAFRYFDDQGTEVIPASPGTLSSTEKARVIFWVNTRVRPRTDRVQTTTGPDMGHLATITVQVANNPGNASLAIEADDKSTNWNLLKTTPGLSITTHSAMVARNK
jgi:uncharacterized protein (TIGR02598 family)